LVLGLLQNFRRLIPIDRAGPCARPSIFNDDDEFATLTSMDAVMLQILYNPRLLPGMTLDQARPYLYEISELLNKPQS
jgi:hypothetical protein